MHMAISVPRYTIAELEQFPVALPTSSRSTLPRSSIASTGRLGSGRGDSPVGDFG